MTKQIGIVCDNYKRKFWRKGIKKDGLEIKFDGASHVPWVHLFTIECEEKDYYEMDWMQTKEQAKSAAINAMNEHLKTR